MSATGTAVVSAASASTSRRRAALEVWAAAVRAEGRPPDAERIGRVTRTLQAPANRVALVERSDCVEGMGVSEPFLEDDGVTVRADWAHVSMVFVHPDHQGRGVGRHVVAGLIRASPMSTFSVWTGTANVRAVALYRYSGFVDTADTAVLPDGRVIGRLQRPPSD